MKVIAEDRSFELIEISQNFYYIISATRIESNAVRERIFTGSIYASFAANNNYDAGRVFSGFMLGYDQATDDARGGPKRAELSLDTGRVADGNIGIL